MIQSDWVFLPISPLPLEQASSKSPMPEKAVMAKGRLPQPSEFAIVTSWVKSSLLFWFDFESETTPCTYWGQGTLVGFYWIAESDRKRYLHKCQELIFILPWYLQKVTKETSSDQSFSILTACENHFGGCNIADAWSLPRPIKSGSQGGASAWTLWFSLVCFWSSQVCLKCSQVWKSLFLNLQFNQHGAVLVCWFRWEDSLWKYKTSSCSFCV